MNLTYKINYYLNQIGTKGRIVWEYNPLHNFRRTKDTDKNGLHRDQIKVFGKVFNKIFSGNQNEYINNNGEILKKLPENNSFSINGIRYDGISITEFDNQEDVIEAGSLVDLDTELLNFSLNNPVSIEAQPSYDGTVNLILNDDRNPPRLINTRFSTRELNTYEIVDRIGDNDTNIYDDDPAQFDLDTSLYKRYQKIPKIIFNRVISGGSLKVGNYVLYFKYCDADGNETDFVAESGIISIFRGNDRDPFSIDGGIRDMNAHKSIDVTLTGIDDAYDYIKVYYTRTSSDLDQNRQTLAYEIQKKYVTSHQQCKIIITGDEDVSDISTTELNVSYFIASTAKTQAQCQNMLFLGNVSKPDALHQDLTDLSLRILPFYSNVESKNVIGEVSKDTYIDQERVETNYEYYNTKNIYYHVGYWNEEIYRFGVVYIMHDNSLSKVYNVRGIGELPKQDEINNSYIDVNEEDYPLFNENGDRVYIPIDEYTKQIHDGHFLENAKGVVRFVDKSSSQSNLYSINFSIPKKILEYLQTYCKVKGLFFVRQKRIPTILAQGLTLPLDPEAHIPMLYSDNFFATESFISQEENNKKEITHDYKQRLIKVDTSTDNSLYTRLTKSKSGVILCPEFETNQAYYNQLFTGTDYPIKYSELQQSTIYNPIGNERFYVTGNYSEGPTEQYTSAKLVSVTEEVPTVAIGEQVFRGVCGMAEEGFRFRYSKYEGTKTKDDTNLLRGIYHPYVGAVFQDTISYGKIVNIYIPGYNISEMSNYYTIRYEDNSPYYAIGDRISIEDIFTDSYKGNDNRYYLSYYRGDCYICNFTHRINRNFQDPSAPTNDEIVDKNSWKDFDPENQDTFDKINLGDINAVKLGSWYTFKVRSSTNLSIRSLDESHTGEKGIFGLSRGFYPRNQELTSGNNKIPDSYFVNDGFRATTGEKLYLRLPDVPYVKNNFENRILYSDIAINDAFRNGYRVFKSTHFNDYSKEYGSIIKLVNLQSGLLCVFEHGVGYIPVNERAVAGEGAGGNIYINTSNVLPDNPKILSDMFGSQWSESIVQTPYYVYGIDTVGKKIWRTNGSQFEIISDFRVNKFLVDNITLTEKDNTPIIGVKNVKSHYNANKSDIMFTFYNSQYGTEDKVWNLCYNEITQKFTTFYSWVPSYSENIDNMFFSFDRTTSKMIAKLGTSQVGSTNSDGVILDSVVFENNQGKILGLANRILPEQENTGITVTYKYYLLKDPYGNYKYFNTGLKEEADGTWEISNDILSFHVDLPENPGKPSYLPDNLAKLPTSENINQTNALEYRDSINSIASDYNKRYSEYLNLYEKYYIIDDKVDTNKVTEDINKILPYINYLLKVCTVQLGMASKKVWFLNIRTDIKVNNNNIKDYEAYKNTWESEYLSYNYGYYTSTIAVTCSSVLNNYVKYGMSDNGSFTQIKNDVETLTSDFWKHGQSGIIDIKDDIRPCLWYGKQHPFEFEFVVRDTPNMHKIFDNLEIISNKCEPESFHFEVVGEQYEFHEDKRNMYYRQEATKQMWQNSGVDVTFDKNYTKITPRQNIKSTIFPIYYNRIDTFDEIYDSYIEMGSNSGNKDYRNLSGSEIVFDKDLDEYRVLTHIKNTPIDKVVTDRFGRQVQIGRIRGNSQYKEDRWKIQIPSITFMQKNENWIDGIPPIVINYVPEDYIYSTISDSCLPEQFSKADVDTDKWTYRKETKIRDKYLKVRVRYTGNELAVITAVLTTYTESYA